MGSLEVEAIDVHAHFGRAVVGKHELCQDLMSATASEIVERARLARTFVTIVSPLSALMPRFKGDPVSGNQEAAEIVAGMDGLLQWIVVDPNRPETYAQADALLPQPKCAGIKIHPEEHGYSIAEHGRAIFEFAARHCAVVQSHSGEQNSMPADFLRFANDFPEVKLIVSHLGCGWDGNLTYQVRAVQMAKHGNVFTDTSSAKSITSNLIEWAVQELGAEHILYGTDSPLYYAPVQRARIDTASISDRDKRLILRDNALGLLGNKASLELVRIGQKEKPL